MTLLLSKSIHLTNTQEKILSIHNEIPLNVDIIVNANLLSFSESVGVKEAFNFFSSISLSKVNFINLYKHKIDFSKKNFFYFIGGNPFDLAKAIVNSSFLAEIQKLNIKDYIFCGNSAGAIVFGKSMRHISYLSPELVTDLESVKLIDFGLSFVDKLVLPHFEFYQEKIHNFAAALEVLPVRDGEIKIYENHV